MADIEQNASIPIDGGLSKLPEPVRIAAEFLALRAAETCVLYSGQTPLFWHLVFVLGEHIKEKR